MKSSDKIDLLSAAFVAAQVELKNATFDKVNPHFKSKYATLAGMRDGVVATLTKHGLAVIQGGDVLPEMAVVTTRLVHTSGQWIESAYPFALDKPQQMGSAMTYARRYSLAAICGIASEEDDDGNAGQDTDRKPTLTSVNADAQRTNNPMDKPITKEETRALKDELCREIDSHTSAMKLRDWAKVPENRSRKASLHPDFQDVVSQSWLEKLNELEKGLAA